MVAILFKGSHMTDYREQLATKPICVGSLFDDAYVAGCVISLR